MEDRDATENFQQHRGHQLVRKMNVLILRLRKSPKLLTLVLILLTAMSQISACSTAANKHSAKPSPVTAELGTPRSPINGLYYPPFLRLETAGPEYNCYALLTDNALGHRSRLVLTAKTEQSLRSEALSASPVTGRRWLLPIREAGATNVLNGQDIRAITALRARDGYFDDPAAVSPAGRISATADAIVVLTGLNALTPEDRQTSASWLRKQLAVPSLIQRSFAADALGLMGAPLPSEIAPQSAPDAVNFGQLDQDARNQLLLDTYGYVRLRTDTGQPAEVDSQTWQQVLNNNVSSLDWRSIYYLVVILKAVGLSQAAFQPVRDRLSAERLPDGSITDPTSYSGDPATTFFGLQLRSLAKEDTQDSEVAKALETAAKLPDSANDRGSRLAIAAALRLAASPPGEPTQTSDCNGPVAVVNKDSVAAWQRIVWYCGTLSISVADPNIKVWSVTDPEGVVAAARLVNAMDDDHLSSWPTWVTRNVFAPYLKNAHAVVNVANYAEVIRAFLILGGSLRPEELAVADQTFRPAKGCPQLPHLYRTDSADQGCDLVTTMAVWQLSSRLAGRYGP